MSLVIPLALTFSYSDSVSSLDPLISENLVGGWILSLKLGACDILKVVSSL